jgi:HD-GYP domain-containing protein (c-di-GMP phosphodiesterase class II)
MYNLPLYSQFLWLIYYLIVTIKRNANNDSFVSSGRKQVYDLVKKESTGERMQSLRNKATQMDMKKLELLEKIWNRAKPEDKEDQFVTNIMRMAHNALNASASLLLLVDEKKQELFLKFADGAIEQKSKRLHVNRQSGIAGWIVRNGKPLVVNDAEKNKKYYRLIDRATGFKTRSIIGVPLIINNKVIGVIEVLNKLDGIDFNLNDLRILTGMATTAALAIEKVRLNASLFNAYKNTVKALVSLADAKETSGGGHSRRVSEYALMGANSMSLSTKEKETIEYAAILHDIGKLSIPDSVLNKSGKLTNEEWELIRRHPVVGFDLLKDIPFLQGASRLILYHHERYDGSGYPYGLKGEMIPTGARLLAVADAFDNMTTHHAYRAALSMQHAFAELRRCSNSQFCPAAVKAFSSGFVKARMLNR